MVLFNIQNTNNHHKHCYVYHNRYVTIQLQKALDIGKMIMSSVLTRGNKSPVTIVKEDWKEEIEANTLHINFLEKYM